eukprot:3625085-Rhodomonas_salina.1
MSGTGIAYFCISLRACYAMSGTDAAYGARAGRTLRAPGTLSAYAPGTRCKLLTCAIVLPEALSCPEGEGSLQGTPPLKCPGLDH